MAFPIGFTAERPEQIAEEFACAAPQKTVIPRRSVVQVRFAGGGRELAYYNDKFDLHCGDLVYVDGKMAGIQGRVTEVVYNFKIRLSDYKRVIAVVDTNVSGQFFFADSHFVTFDRGVLPCGKAIGWFKAPAAEEEEFADGSDDASFPLERLSEMGVSPAIAERGHDYYLQNRVRYLCLDAAHGYAIVAGSEPYEVEFEYSGGRISRLVCSCFCSYACKHQFAVMLQLNETLQLIEENYGEEYRKSGYFAAIEKGTLFSFAVRTGKTGSVLFSERKDGE